MKRRFSDLVLVLVILLISVRTAGSEEVVAQVSLKPVGITVIVPKLLATATTLYRIKYPGHPSDWTNLGEATAINWSGSYPLYLDSVNHIYVSDFMYAIDVAGSGWWSCKFEVTDVVGLQGKIKVAASNVLYTGPGTSTETSMWEGNISGIHNYICRKVDLAQNGDGGVGHWLRVYISIPTSSGSGAKGAWDPIPENQPYGNYSGTIKVTYAG